MTMIVHCQRLNDFFAGLCVTEQWMVELFNVLGLKLPVNVAAQPLWTTLIEVSATTPYVPIGTNENEFILGMAKLRAPKSLLFSSILWSFLLESLTGPPNQQMCSDCGRLLTASLTVSHKETLVCYPRCR